MAKSVRTGIAQLRAFLSLAVLTFDDIPVSKSSICRQPAKNNLQRVCFLVFWNRSGRLDYRARNMETAAQGILTRDEMESRRLLAAQDLQRGLTQSQVARKFGVSRTTASRWHRALSGRGMDGLRKRRAPGRPSRLNAEQLQMVAEIYRSGPRTAGFQTDRWTTARFAGAIRTRFGIQYDPDHVGRIIHRLGLRERVRSHRRLADILYGSLPAPLLGQVVAQPPAS